MDIKSVMEAVETAVEHLPVEAASLATAAEGFENTAEGKAITTFATGFLAAKGVAASAIAESQAAVTAALNLIISATKVTTTAPAAPTAGS